MKLCLIIPLICLSFTISVAQEISNNSKQESMTDQNLYVSAHQNVDSIQSTFYKRADSLKQVYKARFNRLDSGSLRLSQQLDSLNNIPLANSKLLSQNPLDTIHSIITNNSDSLKASAPIQKIKNSLDSLGELKHGAISELNDKMQSLKEKTVGQLKKVDMPAQLSEKVTDATSKVNGFKLPVEDFNMPSMKGLGDANIPAIDNLSLPNIEGEGVGKVGALGELVELGDIPEVAGNIPGYAKDVQQFSNGNLSEVKELPKTADAKAEELSGLSEVNDQTHALNKYKEMGSKMQNPDSLKEMAIEEAKQVAIDHFAGKEEQLKQAMETLSKYKSKYSSLNSLSEIPKRRPNEMKGRPLIERIMPGIAMQIQRKGEDVLVDFSTYAGYRFTGRITAGFGWNQRVAYTIDHNTFNSSARIFGPRMFGEYKLWKGFSPRAEVEVMNTLTPIVTRTPTVDPPNREWVWGVFVGMKKEYKFVKNVKGTAMVMLRLFNPQYKSPYADVVNVRFGFEFPMKKKNSNP